MTSAELTGWLADAGLRNTPLEEIVDGFSGRLNELGVPVARTFVGMNTLRPMVRARRLIWDGAVPEMTHFEFSHAGIDVPQVRESPFAPMLLDGVTERRCDLTDVATVKGVPVLEELHAVGMTDWLGRIFPMGELVPQFGWTVETEHAERLALVCSFTTDQPGGYSEADLAVLEQALPAFALAVKAVTMCALGHSLLVSQAFAEAATASRHRLVSLSRHRLRGMREETEPFALAPAETRKGAGP